MKAFLAHIAEDEAAVGFVGCVMRKDDAGEIMMMPVSFEASRQQMSFAAALLLSKATED